MLFRSTVLAALCSALVLTPSCRDSESPKPARAAAVDPDAPARIQQLLARLPQPPAAPTKLDEALAQTLVQLPLACVGRQYPNKPSDVKSSDADNVAPRQLHPVFFGCFDWHSAVHGHWSLVRLLRLFPDLPQAPKIHAILDRQLQPERIASEVSYFQPKQRQRFERPYGWAWLLRLAAELELLQTPAARRWAAALQPLERLLAQRMVRYLDQLSVPVRAGTHQNTAFALAHVHDYATIKKDRALLAKVATAARRFYLRDKACPADYEPSGEDFISPCLAEADLMRRVLPARELRPWLEQFLFPVTSPRFSGLLRPPEVRDPRDPRIGHLIGLSMHRAVCFDALVRTLPAASPRRELLLRLARSHRAAGLSLMHDSGYGGGHWLASFALLMFGSPPG